MRLLFVIIVFLTFSSFLVSEGSNLSKIINEYRVQHGISSLMPEKTLEVTAEKYTKVLIEEKRISHIDRMGGRVLNRYKAEGGTATEAGEILGTSTELSEIFEAWKNSQSHNDVILNPKWTRIGTSTGISGENLVSVVLFSNSLIDELRYEIVDNGQLMSFNWLSENNLPTFSEDLKAQISMSKENELYTYYLLFDPEVLPLLIPVYNNIDGRKKISDFLYIPDILLDETH